MPNEPGPKLWIRPLLLGVLLLWCATTFGCAGSAVLSAASVTVGFGLAQTQAESYIAGELKSAREASLDEAWDATTDALAKLALDIRHKSRGKKNCQFNARGKRGPGIKVSLEYVSPQITRIEIRVGLMGDPSVSRLIQSRIDIELQRIAPLDLSGPKVIVVPESP